MSLFRASLSFLHSHGFILRNALSYSQRTVASVWCALYCHWREKKETGIQEETWTKMYYCQVFKVNERISPVFLQVWNKISKLAWIIHSSTSSQSKLWKMEQVGIQAPWSVSLQTTHCWDFLSAFLHSGKETACSYSQWKIDGIQEMLKSTQGLRKPVALNNHIYTTIKFLEVFNLLFHVRVCIDIVHFWRMCFSYKIQSWNPKILTNVGKTVAYSNS